MAPQVQQNQYQLKFPPQQYQQGQQYQNQYPLQQSAPTVQQHQQQTPSEQQNQFQYTQSQQQPPFQNNQVNHYPPLQNNANQPIPEKQKLQSGNLNQQNSLNSRKISQQNQQNSQQQQPIQKIPINQNDQISAAGNYGAPFYRKPSQQQVQQNQSFQQDHQIQQGNLMKQEMNYQPQQNLNEYAQMQNNGIQNDQSMQIEESQNSNQIGANNSATTSTTATTKKRGSVGGAKRGKKDQEEKQKLPEVPLKSVKSTNKKADKKGKKKQNNDENMEEEDQGVTYNPPQAEIQMKDESSTFQQPQLYQQEDIQANGRDQGNHVQAVVGSENNIANKYGSQDSMDFQSQTSLGNQVHRQNVQQQKENKFNPPQLQKHPEQQNNQQQIILKQTPFQQPNQPISFENQQISGIQPPQVVEKQLIVNHNPELQPQQFPLNPIDTKIQPPHLQSIISNQQNAMQFQQARQNTALGLKKKTGPLVSEQYKPFFVELVDTLNQRQVQLKQHMILHAQHMASLQNGNIQKQQIQQFTAPSPQNNASGQIPQGQIPGKQNYSKPIVPSHENPQHLQMPGQNGQQQLTTKNTNPQFAQFIQQQQLQQQFNQQKQQQLNLTQSNPNA